MYIGVFTSIFSFPSSHFADEKMWEQVDGQEFTNQEIFLPEADEQPGAQETKKEA